MRQKAKEGEITSKEGVTAISRQNPALRPLYLSSPLITHFFSFPLPSLMSLPLWSSSNRSPPLFLDIFFFLLPLLLIKLGFLIGGKTNLFGATKNHRGRGKARRQQPNPFARGNPIREDRGLSPRSSMSKPRLLQGPFWLTLTYNSQGRGQWTTRR